MQLKTALLAAAVAAAGFTAQSFAATSPATATFNVTATVPNSCKVEATDIDFGSYDPVNANSTTDLPSSGTVTVSCVKGTVATVSLDQGKNPGSGSTCTAPVRQMKDSAGDFLAYNIDQDSNNTTVWGCTSGTNTQGFTSTSKDPSAGNGLYTTYGVIPAGQDVPVGTYSDVVTVSVAF
jgi:spore coat protein U-like protein